MSAPHPHIFPASQHYGISKVKRENQTGTEQVAPDEDMHPEEFAGEGKAKSSPGRVELDPQDGIGNAGGDEVTELKRALEETRAELDRHREAMLRMQADMDNQRKRMTRETEKSQRFALERMMKDLLQVRDSLERGLEVGDEAATVEQLREGKALTLKVLSKVLQDHGLEVIDPQGQPFNPELHEAMTMAPSVEHEENTVLEVLQKGFKLHDRLIRPAMVVVSRKP